ncbi:hypothetical protein [Actinosynnema mirum]|uniref:hypothetical protein n=1 Tax=Actinosynnema mirum TaxID=40567 RepID=UPI0003181715|nr:hypothetical protein [Actinosynnema mirum]
MDTEPAELRRLLHPMDADSAVRAARLLTRVAGTADADAALAVLVDGPNRVSRFDRWFRRAWEATGLAGGDALSLALSACHRDGRVREKAVRDIAAAPRPELVPFLVLRTEDWVPQVREAARVALVLALDRSPGLAEAALGVVVRMARGRRDAAFVRRQVAAVLGVDALDRLLGSPDLLVAAFALERATPSTERLLALARTSPHVRVRAVAAERLAREAVWTNRIAVLRELAAVPRPEVGSVALVGLTRLGATAEVAEHVADRSALVRALARATGVDALTRYRAEASRGAVDGLAEIGSADDADVLLALLDHPRVELRVRALRALRTLRVQADERVVPLLRDPSPKVVREAATAVRHPSAELVAGLLADERPEVRQAGYRLSRGMGGAAWLRAVLSVAGDPHEPLARLAEHDALRLASVVRGEGVLARRSEFTPEERGELRAGLERVAGRLPERAVPGLRMLLD